MIIIRKLLRKLSNQFDTWWDYQNYNFLKNDFLRSGNDLEDGIDHPSRTYIRKWLKNHPRLSLLDIPTGAGVEYEGFKRYHIPVNYIGVDFSDTMLKICKERYPEINVKKGQIQSIPLRDNSVDVVLCRHILEHIPDYPPAIMEALRVSKKYVFLILFRKPNKKVTRPIGWGSYDNRLDLKELVNFLKLLKVKSTIKVVKKASKSHLEDNTIILLEKM